MKPKEVRPYYRRNLPHWQPVGGMFFVTFRLQGSIPQAKLIQLKQTFDFEKAKLKSLPPAQRKEESFILQEQFFREYDALLDAVSSGPDYLRQPTIATIVVEQLKRFDGELYKLIAYTVMPNHVHILIDTAIQLPKDMDLSDWETLSVKPLEEIMKRIKGASATYANRHLGRTGRFWQKESYDHFVKSRKALNNIIYYILGNPVKAKLSKSWEHHPYTYYCTDEQ